MSAHIPEHRRAINSRTWDREWHPEAIEVYRRPLPWADRVLGVLLALSIAGAIVALLVNEFGG